MVNARVGEAEVQDLVGVLPERLHLHTGHRVIEAAELLEPRRGRCGGAGHAGAAGLKPRPWQPGAALPALQARSQAQPAVPSQREGWC